MRNSTWRVLAITALALAGAAAIGMGAYNAGVAAGIAESGRAMATPGAPYPPYMYGWPRQWAFGFFPFFPIFPIVFFVLFFVVLRGLVWRGPWRGGWGTRYDGVPPAFEEWHRRAHGAQPGTTHPMDNAGAIR
jgi:hypothetical protein